MWQVVSGIGDPSEGDCDLQVGARNLPAAVWTILWHASPGSLWSRYSPIHHYCFACKAAVPLVVQGNNAVGSPDVWNREQSRFARPGAGRARRML